MEPQFSKPRSYGPPPHSQQQQQFKMTIPSPQQHSDNDRSSSELRAVDCNLNSLCEHIQMEGFSGGSFSDIVVNAMGSTYHLHRLILSRSSYFRNMLHGPWKEANAPVVALNVDDSNVNCEAIAIALAYLYGHHPKLNDSNAFRVLAAASFLDLQTLHALLTSDELWVPNEEQRFELALHTLLAKGTFSNAEHPDQGSSSPKIAMGIPPDSSKAKGKDSIDSCPSKRLDSELECLSLKDDLAHRATAQNLLAELADCVEDIQFRRGTSSTEQQVHLPGYAQAEPIYSCNMDQSSSMSNSFSDAEGMRTSGSYVEMPIGVGTSGLGASGMAMEGPSEEGSCYHLNNNNWLTSDQSRNCSSVDSSCGGLMLNDWGRCGIGRGATFVPATAWPPTRFVFSRVPFGMGNRNGHQSLANDDSEARADHSGDMSGGGLTALVELSQGGSSATNVHGEQTERSYETDLQTRVPVTSVAGPATSGIAMQMLESPEHAVGIEWENATGSAISLDMKTPLSHFPPFRFGVQFEDVHRLNDGQVKHSPEFFYAGSLWKVSVQAFNDEDPQGRRTLGLFLHRRKAEITDSLRKVHTYVDSREKVTARYQLICPSKREVMVFGSFKQRGTLLPKAPKGWGWRTALLFDELADLLQNGALRVAAVVQLV
ncbi:BTB/POZ-like protein [Corchorus olitorius]|uniref:BTB/POZ-like protein n=1 Tax=Corchorus olitorius TaxID=93759 RepID=A0A1R3JUA5_9ROSI|nr:BTB/POZ-like protein [Corchorus olitorius]